MSDPESSSTTDASTETAAPKLGPVWWGLLVLSLGMLGWGLRPFPMDTKDATLEQALARGKLDRATAILEARQADRPEEAAADLDAVQSDDAASAPEVQASPDAWSWAEVAFIGGTLGDMPALKALRAVRPSEGTVQRVYACLYETHDLARLEVVLDWIDDDLIKFPTPDPDRLEYEFVHHPGAVNAARFPASSGFSATTRRDLFRTPLRPDDLPDVAETKDGPQDEWREWLLAACLRSPSQWSSLAQSLLDVGHDDPDLVLLAAGHFPQFGLEQDRRQFLEHLGFLIQPERAPGIPVGRGQYVALLNAFADGVIRSQNSPEQELVSLERFDALLFPQTQSLLSRIWPPGSTAAEFAERTLIAGRYVRLAEITGKQPTSLDPFFTLGRGREAHAVGGETASRLLDRVEILLTPCFQTLSPDAKVLTQARMLLATARDLHGDLEGAYLLRSALADEGDAAHGTEVFFPLAINALALAALENDEERFTNYLVKAGDALERCDPDHQMENNIDGSDGQATQAGIKVARTLLGLLQAQAQPERHLAQASFDATPEAVVARSILTAHCALIGGRYVVAPDDFEEGEVLEHHADALRALLTASSELMAPSQSQNLKPYQFEVWRLRIQIAAAQSPPDWETVRRLLGEIEQTYNFRDQAERRTFLSWLYRADKELGEDAAAARIKEQLDHLDREMREQAQRVAS